MRKTIDSIYKLTMALAAACIVLICLMIIIQVTFNILARIGGAQWSFTIPSYAVIVGYLLSAASFLALADTLAKGVHIRVNMLTSRLSTQWQVAADCFALGLGFLFSIYMTHAALQVWLASWKFGDKSSGILAIPLWIPQGFMVLGLVALTIAFLDLLITAIRTRTPLSVEQNHE